MSRTQNVLRNASTMLVTYFITIFVSFFARSVFIKQLGTQYLGLHGVFSSILSMLSISDLGMESVFAFLLYKPIAHKNQDLIRSLIALFRKIYSIVGLFIFISGLSVLPFLSKILGEQGKGLKNVVLIYLIMLVNIAASYLFTYNRTILNANQKNYVITSISFIINLIVNVLQIMFLYLINSMVIYVSLLLVSTISTNIILSRLVLKNYPFLQYLPTKSKLSAENKKILVQNTIGGLSNKLGSIVVFASDNILLSIFVNLSTVGLYSNYTLIMNSLTSIIQKVLGTITASIGNLSVESPERGIEIFKKTNFLLTLLVFFCAPQLLTILRPIVAWWLGENYVLSQYIVMLIVINFVLQVSRLPSLTYIDAYGLQWIQKWKSVIEATLNIIFSLIALKIFHLGLAGILLGTILSTFLFVSWYEPYIVFRFAFHKNSKQQIKLIFICLIEKFWVVIPTVLSWIAMHYLKSTGIVLVLEMISLNFLIIFIAFLLIFSRRKEMNWVYNFLAKLKK